VPKISLNVNILSYTLDDVSFKRLQTNIIIVKTSFREISLWIILEFIVKRWLGYEKYIPG